jgi:uncharacterized membrane protein
MLTSLYDNLRTDRLTWLSRMLSLAGLCISSYLAWTYLHHQAPVCTITHGCAAVEHSKWARPAGIPLPLFGMLGYMLLFIAACMRGQRARTIGMVLTVGAISLSLFLTYLELNVIHAVCIWCVSSATCAALHVVVNSTRYVRGEPNVPPRNRPGGGQPFEPHPLAG